MMFRDVGREKSPHWARRRVSKAMQPFEDPPTNPGSAAEQKPGSSSGYTGKQTQTQRAHMQIGR